LEDALSKHSDVRSSLIVLPEAFNNGKRYYDEPKQEPGVGVKCALQQLAAISKRLGLTFVAGMLDPPHNSAYLIDSDDDPKAMCHKQDHSGNHRPCTTDSDINNPIEHEAGDACIGALICADPHYNRQRVTRNVENSSRTYKIICVPAWMSEGNLDSSETRVGIGR